MGWDTYDDWLEQLDWTYDWLEYHYENIYTWEQNAWDNWGAGEDHAAMNWILMYMSSLRQFLHLFIYGSTTYKTHRLLPHAFHEFLGAVDWKSICEAWVKNDFEGKEWTIACIDHMRKLMWDKPFTIKWASKPETEKE